MLGRRPPDTGGTASDQDRFRNWIRHCASSSTTKTQRHQAHDREVSCVFGVFVSWWCSEWFYVVASLKRRAYEGNPRITLDPAAFRKEDRAHYIRQDRSQNADSNRREWLC